MTRQESGRRAGRKYGKQNGKRAVESGQLAEAGKLVSPDHIQELGLVQGKLNRESGHIQRIQKLACSLGGKAQSAADPGHIFRITNFSTRSKGGKVQTHQRWHTARGINKPTCELCVKEIEERKARFAAVIEPPVQMEKGAAQ
jgi:hypothetical protein